MQMASIGIRALIFLVPVSLLAQTRDVTNHNNGETGAIPVYTGTTTVGNSIISNFGSTVGIGTALANPWDTLMISADYNGGGGLGIIGQVSPAANFYGWSEVDLFLGNTSAGTPLVPTWATGSEGYYSDNANLTKQDFYIFDQNSGIYNFAVDASDNVYVGGNGYWNAVNNPSALALFAGTTGNVGVGTITPGARLEVNGNVKLTAGSGATLTFADGTVQTTAYPGATPGGDFAESVDVTGDRATFSPGDILTIDPEHPGRFLKSTEPYSTAVTGIYSTRPGTVGRRQLTPKSPDEVPMAMVGIVPTKVTTESGPIHPGDLLVTSSTLGYAMKGTDRNRLTGAVIGKALGSLDSGKGVIEAVVTLQ
jgi:hypothetical protein